MMILNNPSEGESTCTEVLLNRSFDIRIGFEDLILSNVFDGKLELSGTFSSPFFNDSASELAENSAYSEEGVTNFPITSGPINVRSSVARSQTARYQPGKEVVGQR